MSSRSPSVAPPEIDSMIVRPIGRIRTPFLEKMEAPRQPPPNGAEGRIELFSGCNFEHALEDLELWDRIWVLFWFHLNDGWRPKVLPPRSDGRRRGVFSTRAPHRPNPIGMSALELVQVRADDRLLIVRGVDMIDGTPVLDIKPYVAYCDAYPDAATGWLGSTERGDGGNAPSAAAPPADPRDGYRVDWGPRAAEQVAWLRSERAIDLAPAVERVLAQGPQPHPYRRIRRDGDRYLLAHKEWRIAFRVEGRTVRIDGVASGFRREQLAPGQSDPTDTSAATLDAHRAFVARFAPEAPA